MKKGYVTLLSVVVLGALFSVIAVLLLDIGLSSGFNSVYWKAEVNARAAAHACSEDALQAIRNSTPFTGNGSATLANGSCSYSVSNTGGQNREILAVGASGDHSFRVKVIIDAINPDINVVSWDELADF